MSFALAIIAKDEVEAVKNIINLYEKYFDEIAIAVDQRVDEFKALEGGKVKIHEYVWINDFSHKRNFLAEKINSTHYFRLDTDDIISNPEKLPEIFSNIEKFGVDILFVKYDYAKNEKGQCIAAHQRETVIKKRPDVYWKKRIHENLFVEDPNIVKMVKNEDIILIHNIDESHAQESFNRNLQYLLEEFKEDGENTDPRTIAYLGRMLAGKGQYEKAILFLEKLIEKSGWNDDKYFAYVQMAQCYQSLNNLDMAIACCNEALSINTKYPDAYLQMGAVYLQKNDYEKAVDWYMPGISRPAPNTVMVLDPTLYSYKGKANAALALLGKGDIEKAIILFREAEALGGDDDLIKKYKPLFIEAYTEDSFIKNLHGIYNYLLQKDSSKINLIADIIPQEALKSERVCILRNRVAKQKLWSDKSIVFYCGPSWEDWADFSVIKGIGGSEEAVIYLSRELVKLGWDVTVYNQCGNYAGVYNGVVYKNFHEINQNDTFNYFISWRNNIFKDVKIKSKRNILWLHDVPLDLYKDKAVSFSTVVVLSDFHKSLLPKNIPESKIFVSSNGINSIDFNISNTIRNPKRMIYTSSYDRGIQHLLLMWPDVKKEVPEAELHLFYGWNTYDKICEIRKKPADFKNTMMELMKQEGVYEHGRIGHKALVKEFMKSSIWVYPSHFEEISCISAMKAQAAGCIPVCTNYAALNETVKTGIKIEGSCTDEKVRQEFKEKLIEILKDEKKQEEVRKQVEVYRNNFGWDRVAKQWTNELFIGNPIAQKEVVNV